MAALLKQASIHQNSKYSNYIISAFHWENQKLVRLGKFENFGNVYFDVNPDALSCTFCSVIFATIFVTYFGLPH